MNRMKRLEFLTKAAKIMLPQAIGDEKFKIILDRRLYEKFDSGFQFRVSDCQNLLVGFTSVMDVPSSFPPPQVILVRESKPKNNFSGLTIFFSFVLIAIIILGLLMLQSPEMEFVKNLITAPRTTPNDCSVPNSTFLEFTDKKMSSGQVIRLPKKTPVLTEGESVICFKVDEMNTFIGQSIEASGGTVDGRMALASVIVTENAKLLSKSDDPAWKNDLYTRIEEALDPVNFKPMDQEGFSYVTLPGLSSLIAQAQPTATLRAPSAAHQQLVIPSLPQATPTPLMQAVVVQDTPTSMPRPTYEVFQQQFQQNLSTAYVEQEMTQPPAVTPPPQPAAVTLDWLINNQLGGILPACSPSGYVNYFTYWPPRDNVIDIYVGGMCPDGSGPHYFVQLPSSIASRHVGDAKYTQIWITKNPIPAHGPSMDIGYGYSIQPFE